MKSVAIICGGGILSGKEIMVLQLADGLREAGLTVEVVSSRWSDGKFGDRLSALQIPTHKVWFGFISASLHPKNVYMTLMQLLRWPQLLVGYRTFLHRFKPEKVIHTNWHSLLGISPFLRRDREIYWVHEVMPDKAQYRKVFRWLDQRLRCFVAVSHAVADSLSRLGVKRERVHVIYNGLDARQFTFTQPDWAVSNVGIVGQIGAWKGHEDLIKAFAIAATKFPAVRLHIYGRGSGEYEAFLRKEVEKLGLTGRVDWCGYVSDPVRIYSCLTILAVPSRSEDPLPTVAIEAAFCGVPVIESSRGGLGEIIEHGKTGFLFPAGNIEEAARYLVTLLADAELRRTLGENAKSRAKDLFAKERFLRSFMTVLRD